MKEASRARQKNAYLFQERISEGLNAELEGSIIRGFIKALHLLRHQSLVNKFTLGVRHIH
jgi:hypothetical protein